MRYEITATSFHRYPSIEAFRNAIEEMRFIFKASKLCEIGMASSDELIKAVEQAMKVCIISGIPIRNHFKAFYIVDDIENPMVGKLQLELIKKYIS